MKIPPLEDLPVTTAEHLDRLSLAIEYVFADKVMLCC